MLIELCNLGDIYKPWADFLWFASVKIRISKNAEIFIVHCHATCTSQATHLPTLSNTSCLICSRVCSSHLVTTNIYRTRVEINHSPSQECLRRIYKCISDQPLKMGYFEVNRYIYIYIHILDTNAFNTQPSFFNYIDKIKNKCSPWSALFLITYN